MSFFVCLLLLWTLGDAAQLRNNESTKIEDELQHPMDGNRIINGNNAQLGWFPHQVSLQSSSGFHFCGGSIISQEWIVTAAHCVVGGSLSLSQMRVVSGTINRLSGTTHQVVEGYYDGKYNDRTVEYDYAALRVSPPFRFSSYTKPISLGYGSPSGLSCYSSGWGRDSQTSNSSPTYLQYIKENARSDYTCSMYTSSYNADALTCTWTPGYNTCNGDSGGPLTCYKDGIQRLYGIVSFGSPNCGWETPTYFADAASSYGRNSISRACKGCV